MRKGKGKETQWEYLVLKVSYILPYFWDQIV